MVNIKAFSFYSSYHEALKDLPEEDRKAMLLAIDDFVFENKTPALKGILKTIWVLIEPTLTKSKNKAQNAKKENQTEIKSKTNQNQTSHDIFNDNSYSYINYQLSFINISNNKNKKNIINSIKEYILLRYNNDWSIEESTIERLVEKLNEYGKTDEDKLEIIGNAIDSKWKKFYPLEQKKKKEDVEYETI